MIRRPFSTLVLWNVFPGIPRLRDRANFHRRSATAGGLVGARRLRRFNVAMAKKRRNRWNGLARSGLKAALRRRNGGRCNHRQSLTNNAARANAKLPNEASADRTDVLGEKPVCRVFWNERCRSHSTKKYQIKAAASSVTEMVVLVVMGSSSNFVLGHAFCSLSPY